MDLKEIGFYTLSDKRAKNSSVTSPLMRCELILTDACNFSCPYCRGLRDDIKGTMSFEKAIEVIDLWAKDSLENIRLSGGEPTIYPNIVKLVKHAKSKGIKRIAMSTNGSASLDLYKELIEAGVNDFSISLDACCASYGDKMAGGIDGIWNKLTDNIKELSKLTYVSVGVVLTEDTIDDLVEIVSFAESLGVTDIRIIPSAQFNQFMDVATKIPAQILSKYPILNYRVNNINNGVHVRGLQPTDNHQCPLVLDDMAIAGNYHFPCVIYMREQGNPIGEIGENMRQERMKWMKSHDTHCDEICKKNCLDVCIDYNNKHLRFDIANAKLPRVDSSHFDWTSWNSACFLDLGVTCRYDDIISARGKEILQRYAIGWTYAESVPCRPKENHVAVMYEKDDSMFWFHMRNSEFQKVFCESN